MERFDWKLTIRMNILMLKVAGLWPQGDQTYKLNLYTLYAIISISLFIYGHNIFQAINIFFIFNNLEAITATLFISLSTTLAILKSYYLIQNMGMLKQLFIILNSDIFQPKNQRQRHLIQPNLDFWKTIYVLYWGLSIGALFFWSTYPILDKSVADYRLPFLAWYPFNTKTSPFYEITYIYQVVSICFIATATLSTDTLIAALNMYIGAQFDLLCDNLRHLFLTKDNPSNINKKIIDCVNHHREILRFAANSNKFYNWIVLVQFLTSGISIGVTMFQLTTVKAFSSEFYSLFSFGNAIIVEIFMYCWFGNEVEIKSSNITYAIFESNWTGLSLEAKRNLIFITMKCQKPLKVSTVNLFYLSIDTFMKIIRASWSYFALLHQFSD